MTWSSADLRQPVDEAAEISYLADAVVLLRYFELTAPCADDLGGEEANGDHERTIREARVEHGGLTWAVRCASFRVCSAACPASSVPRVPDGALPSGGDMPPPAD